MPIYVDSTDPAGDVETFIEKFLIDENFKPLSRLLRRYSKRLVSEDNADVTVPSAFVTGNYTLASADDGDSFTLSVTALPATGGSPITIVQYKVDAGAWVDLPSATTPISAVVEVAGPGTYAVALRAVNTIGPGPGFSKNVVVVVKGG